MLYTCNSEDQFYVKPVTKVLEKGIQLTTWKYEDDQDFFNFEIQYPLDAAKDDLHYDSGGYFMGDYGDYIDCIGTVKMKDDLLIISGWKMKGIE